MLNGKVYDIVKWSSAVFLPALNGLWLALGATWGLPLVEQVSATLIAINVFLGLITGISSVEYYKNREI